MSDQVGAVHDLDDILGYQRRRRGTRRLDFEDMLGLALQLFDSTPRRPPDSPASSPAFRAP